MSDVSETTESMTVDPSSFSDEFRATADRLVRRYPVARSALLPLLHLVQSEHGFVSDAGIAFCATRLSLTKAEVAAVATFYTMFKRRPVGDYLLSVCCNPTCQVAGAQVIFDRYRDALGGELTDPDTKVSIEEAECLGICDAAPVVQVNYEMYGPLTDEEADRLLDACRTGQPPVSGWSGEPAPSFREVERELSGADDTFLDANIEAARRDVEHDVPPAYKSGETDIPVTAPGGDPGGHGGEFFAEAFRAPADEGTEAPTGGQPGTADGPTREVASHAAPQDAPNPVQGDEPVADPKPDAASSLEVDGIHHPDAVADPDTSGATTDITDTSQPSVGREPGDPGDATLPAPEDPRGTPEGTTAPGPGAPVPTPEEANPAVGDEGAEDAAASAPESGSEVEARLEEADDPADPDTDVDTDVDKES